MQPWRGQGQDRRRENQAVSDDYQGIAAAKAGVLSEFSRGRRLFDRDCELLRKLFDRTRTGLPAASCRPVRPGVYMFDFVFRTLQQRVQNNCRKIRRAGKGKVHKARTLFCFSIFLRMRRFFIGDR